MDTNQSVDEVTFTAFDFETTGLHAGLDRIVEVGAVRFKGAQVLDELSSLVNPGTEISEDALSVSGITNDMVSQAPSISEVLPRFLKLCEGTVIVAHNASFDLGFLRAALQEAGLPEVENRVVDTHALAQRAFPRQKSYGLQSLVEMLGLPENNAHRALDDARQCKRLFEACCRELAFMGELTLQEVLT